MPRRPRISISRLMLMVLAIALAIAALRASTPLAASLVYTSVLLILLTGVIGSVAGLGQRRYGWFGLTVFGVSYLSIAFGPWAWLNNESLRPPPLATLQLANLIPWWTLTGRYGPIRMASSQPSVSSMSSSADVSLMPGPGGLMFTVRDAPGEQIIHCLMALAFAAVGFAVGSYFSDKPAPSEP